jgi:hypothetical protein
MIKTNEAKTIRTEAELLWREFKEYVDVLKRDWLRNNRVDSKDVYEVMRPDQREQVQGKIRQWEAYITPFAEAWWKERGYRVIWPHDNSEPMQIQKLENCHGER